MMSQPTPDIEDLVHLVRRQLGIREVRFEHELQADLGAESIDIQNLVTAAEKRYDVRLEDEELAELETVGDLLSLLRSKV